MIQRIKPSLAQEWLVLLAGLTWTAIGVYLSQIALGWLLPWREVSIPSFLALGVLLAVIIGSLGFSWFAKRNISRINQLPERPCLFAFQGWTSYPLIFIMMSIGILLRSSPLPKPLLAPMYLGIGGGLVIASVHYYEHLRQERRDG